jgi:hypothetical protein
MRRALVATTLGIGLLAVVGVGPLLAAPSNSPGASVGTGDCGSAGSFSFVVGGGGGNGTGNAWSPAFLTNGAMRALFIPTAFHLTFTSPMGSFENDVTKGNVTGSVTCTVTGHAVNGPFTFTGTVTGNLVTIG